MNNRPWYIIHISWPHNCLFDHFLSLLGLSLGANIWKSESCICLQNTAGSHFPFDLVWQSIPEQFFLLNPFPFCHFARSLFPSILNVITAVTFYNDKGWDSCWDFWFKCYFMAVPPLFLFVEKTQDLRNALLLRFI